MARCPECAGFMKYVSFNKQMICSSCGLSVTRHELDIMWKKVRDSNFNDNDDHQRKKSKRKEWLDWYSKSKEEKQGL